MYKSVRGIRKEKKGTSIQADPHRQGRKRFRARDRPETGKKRQNAGKKRRGHVVDIDPETRRCFAERGEERGEGDNLRDPHVSVGGGEEGGGGECYIRGPRFN